MATAEITTTTTTTNTKVHTYFDNLEAQKTLLSKCTDLYKTLTSHFTNLHQSIDSKTLTLESKLQSLDSLHQSSLSDLHTRENSISTRFSSLKAEIESKRESSIAELEKPVDETAPLHEVLKSLCIRMDYSYLARFVICKRKETLALRGKMKEALKECVDPARMVLETVKEFLEAKAKAAAEKKGMTDKRWACGVIVTGLFPPEELKEGGSMGPVFSRKTVAEAEVVVRVWKEKAELAEDEEEEEGGGGGSKMGSAEVAMFLQLVLGFGLKEVFDEEFYKKIVMEFCGRRDMAKLAIPIFGDEIGDLIDQLVKNGKDVEAVYFASESGLTERFQPASLLRSYMRKSKKNTTEILKKGNHSASATEEANSFEISYIKSILRCVEDHKLEAEFGTDSLRKRLSSLEKAKADKKRGSAAKPSNKRVFHSGAPPRSSGAPPPRPAKRGKFPSSYPSYSKREEVSPALSPVSRYLGSYSLSSQTAYDPGLAASTYGLRYGASHAPTTDQISQQHQIVQQHYTLSGGSAQQHYAVPVGSVPGGSAPSPSAGPLLGSSYGLQAAYGTYDYGATTTSTYQPPYAQ